MAMFDNLHNVAALMEGINANRNHPDVRMKTRLFMDEFNSRYPGPPLAAKIDWRDKVNGQPNEGYGLISEIPARVVAELTKQFQIQYNEAYPNQARLQITGSLDITTAAALTRIKIEEGSVSQPGLQTIAEQAANAVKGSARFHTGGATDLPDSHIIPSQQVTAPIIPGSTRQV